MAPISVFRTSLPGVSSIPDPLQIHSVYQWYYLDSFSENLIGFDHLDGKYEPILAQSWVLSKDQAVFKLKENLKFHDGSPLLAKDVVASLRRVVKMKTSTHFEVWEDLPACEENICEAFLSKGDYEVVMNYRGAPETLFMFLASPEGSVWSWEDMMLEPFNPKKFSGFYFPKEITKDHAILTKNPHSPRLAKFPKAPDAIEFHETSRLEGFARLKENKLDAIIVDHTPYSPLFEDLGSLKIHSTVPLSFVHLLKVGSNHSSRPFNRTFVEEMWRLVDKSGFLVPAYSIIPPGVEAQMEPEETLGAISSGSSSGKAVRVGIFKPYYSSKFEEVIKVAALESKMEIKTIALTREEFFEAYIHPEKSRLDYLLTGYLASDKFSLMQLKLILAHNKVPFSFSNRDKSPEATIALSRRIQRYALENQLLIPLYYASFLTVYGSEIDLGNQPVTDGEIQFWRINENIATR